MLLVQWLVFYSTGKNGDDFDGVTEHLDHINILKVVYIDLAIKCVLLKHEFDAGTN